jgi:glycosyltransferase involved in cell wall biosynthesis
MPARPYFSVIIPCYNRKRELNRALESLCVQTFKDFDVLVCDDGSTDLTRDVVASFTGKMAVTYLREENWGGPARPRNNGLKVARGEWVCFLDSDDWWYPEKLATVFAFTHKADVIHHDCAVFDSSGKKFLQMRGRQLKKPVFIDLMTGWNALYTSTVCVKKTILDSVGGFSEDRALIAIEDFDLWTRISRVTDLFIHIPRILGAYWTDGGNISVFSEKSIARETAFYERFSVYLVSEERREAAKMLSYRKGIILWHLGHNTESRKMFVNALGTKRFRTWLLAPLWITATFFIHKKAGRRA